MFARNHEFTSLAAVTVTMLTLCSCSQSHTSDGKQENAQTAETRRKTGPSVSYDRAPTTFREASQFILRVNQLTHAEKFDEVAQLITKLESVPDSAMREPFSEASHGLIPSNGEPVVIIQRELPELMDEAAKMLDEHKQYALSERLLLKAIAGRKTLGEFSLVTLGHLEWHLNNVRGAQGKYDQIANDAQQVVSSEGPSLSKLGQLGDIYLSSGKYAEAENVFRQIYARRQSEQGTSLDKMDALRGLGKACYLQGKHAEASDKYGEVVSLVKQGSGWQNSPHFIPDFTNYAEALRKAGRNSEADAAERDRAMIPWPRGSKKSAYRKDGLYDLD